MYCPSCGTVTQATVALCSGCGVRIGTNRRQLALASLSPVESRALIENRPEEDSAKPIKSLPVLPSLALATVGGFVAIPGAFQGELLSGVLGPWLGAPIVEEILKPSGIFLLLLKWPGSIRNRFLTAIYGAFAGLAFGLVESLIYVTVYYSNPTQHEVLIRFTIPVFLHIVASFIFAFGITRQLPRAISGGGALPAGSWVFFLIAIVLHSSYNVLVGTVFL